MAHTTTLRTRRLSEGGGPRFWAALVLAVTAAAAGWGVLGRDVDWPSRNSDARARALAAENAGDYISARNAYDDSLAADPYDWKSRLRLANLLNRRLRVRDEALRHYLLVLAYTPDSAAFAETEKETASLRLIAEGVLEDPADALEDMFLAVESGAGEQFLGRLDPGLLADGDSYWNAWRERGRGEIVFNRMEDAGNGLHDAVVELAFADGSSMSMHLRCPLRNVWRLSLSFP